MSQTDYKNKQPFVRKINLVIKLLRGERFSFSNYTHQEHKNTVRIDSSQQNIAFPVAHSNHYWHYIKCSSMFRCVSKHQTVLTGAHTSYPPTAKLLLGAQSRVGCVTLLSDATIYMCRFANRRFSLLIAVGAFHECCQVAFMRIKSRNSSLRFFFMTGS